MKRTIYLIVISVFCIIALSNCAKPIDACFDYSPDNPDTTTWVTFNGGCSENAFQYKWNFGDGSADTTSEGFIVKHKYKTPGSYTVRLNAQRKDGVTIRKEKPIVEKVIIVQ
jgi:PKD repeat protein